MSATVQTQISLTINGHGATARAGQTILEAARVAGIDIPTLCHLEGLMPVGSCRLCLVEIVATGRLVPACAMLAEEGMEILTDTPVIRDIRLQVIELLFAKRNHICAVCVANGHCELQGFARSLGVTHINFDYRHPPLPVDASHPRFAIDHNRCILCARCVRVCDEVEGAHTWDVMGRGVEARVISDLNQPWGESTSCTSCGKCVQVCPTGALFEQGRAAREMTHDRGFLSRLLAMRERPR